jgi:hypothetical protein
VKRQAHDPLKRQAHDVLGPQAHDLRDTRAAPDMRWPPRRAGTRRPAVSDRGSRRAPRPALRDRDDDLVLDQETWC